MLVDSKTARWQWHRFYKKYTRKIASSVPIMVLSSWNTFEVIYKALRVGASGYVFKRKR